MGRGRTSREASGGPTRYAHNGGINGFNSFLTYYPESRVTVVVLANVNGPAADDLGGKLSSLALGDPVVLLQSDRKEINVSS